MILSEGGLRGPSYNDATAQEKNGGESKRPTFEPPPDLRSQLIFEGTFKDREMDINSGKATPATSTSQP